MNGEQPHQDTTGPDSWPSDASPPPLSAPVEDLPPTTAVRPATAAAPTTGAQLTSAAAAPTASDATPTTDVPPPADVPPTTVTTPVKEPLTWRQVIMRLLALALVLVITIGIFKNQETIIQLAGFGYPGIFLISLLGNATLVLPAPTFVIITALGCVLNPLAAGLAAGIGAGAGEMTGYLAGFGGRSVIENRVIYQRLVYFMKRWGAWLVLGLAIVPNPIFDIGGIIAGTLKMDWWKFLLASVIGKSIRFMSVFVVCSGLLAL